MKGWVTSASYKAAVQTIVNARLAAGLSQAALAEKIGQYPSFIAKIELGERRIDVIEFVILARALGVPERQMFGQLLDLLPEALT